MSTGLLLKTASIGPRRFIQQLKDKPLQNDFQLFFGIVIVVSFFTTLESFFMALYQGNDSSVMDLSFIGTLVLGTCIGLVQGLITGVVALLGTSLVEHFFLLFVDVRQGFEMTVKSAIYALSPLYPLFCMIILAEIPYVGLILLFCFGLITCLGIQVFHELSKGRAAFVALATSAVLLIIFREWTFIFVNGHSVREGSDLFLYSDSMYWKIRRVDDPHINHLYCQGNGKCNAGLHSLRLDNAFRLQRSLYAMNPRNRRILFVILTAGVIVYGLLTYQWLLMIVGILLLALAFFALKAIR